VDDLAILDLTHGSYRWPGVWILNSYEAAIVLVCNVPGQAFHIKVHVAVCEQTASLPGKARKENGFQYLKIMMHHLGIHLESHTDSAFVRVSISANMQRIHRPLFKGTTHVFVFTFQPQH
jgi:hypothetical protein